MRYEKTILMGLVAGLLSGCSSVGSFFNSDKSSSASAATVEIAQQNTSEKAQPEQTATDQQQETTTAVATTTDQTVNAATQPVEAATNTTATTTATVPATSTQPGTAVATSATTKAAPAATNLPPANGLVALSMQMGYQQAWTQLGTSLPKAGYPIVEQDSNAGIYYILDKVGSGGTITQQTPIYQLHLQKITADKTRVFLYDAQSQPASSSVAQRILGSVTTH